MRGRGWTRSRGWLILLTAVLLAAALFGVTHFRSEPPPLPHATPDVTGAFFRSDSIWRAQLPHAPELDPESRRKIDYLLRNPLHPNLTLRKYGVAVVVATPETRRRDIDCSKYDCPSMDDFGPVPIPSGSRPDPSSDGHLAVWDPVSHREWDFWQSGCPDDCDRASSGGAVDTDVTNPQMRNGAASAAGWPLLAGIIRPEELKAGEIRHPLIFSTPDVADDHVCPAVQHDGENPHPLALPEGTLVQLDPAVEVGILPIPAWQRTIARALQRYGMYLRDGGGSLAIGGENPLNRTDVWAEIGLEGDAAAFAPEFPWHELRVLTPLRPWC